MQAGFIRFNIHENMHAMFYWIVRVLRIYHHLERASVNLSMFPILMERWMCQIGGFDNCYMSGKMQPSVGIF